MSEIHIYTDGACRPNPGVGAYAFVVLNDKDEKQFESTSRVENTTCNAMELSAVIEALAYCLITYVPECKICIHTDSQYVKYGITVWIHGWKKRNWTTSEGKPVKNQELWIALDNLVQQLHIEFRWVRGHHISKWNNYVDELCSRHY